MTKDHSEANLQENVIAHVLTYNNVLITRRKAFLIKSALIKIAETPSIIWIVLKKAKLQVMKFLN